MTTDVRHWPLVPFEHYMMCDDTVDYPMTCHLRFWFEGTLHQKEFTEAIEEATLLHPLFRSTIAGSASRPLRMLRWLYNADLRPVVTWGDQNLVIKPHSDWNRGLAVSLRHNSGLRVWIRREPSQALATFQFHHAHCDGVGFFAFFDDVLKLYARKCDTSAAVNIEDHTLRMNERDTHDTSYASAWSRFLWSLKRAGKYFATLPMPLASDGKAFVEKLLAAERQTLDERVFARYRGVAKRLGATVNDLLLRDFFVVIKDWNENHQHRSSWRPIRIAMPISMRSENEAPLPAVNRVSMVFLDRHAKHMQDEYALLQSIVRETAEIKATHTGHSLLRVVKILGKLPLLMRLFFRAPVCSATAVLTNLGLPLQTSQLCREGKLTVPGATLTALDTLPPVRAQTAISLSVNSYGGDFSATLRYDTAALSEKAAQLFLSMFISKMNEIALS